MSSPSFEAPTLEALAELLPAYDFESFIAQGGMGAVYKARQRSLDRDVAIKILPRELGADPDFRHSFATEAKAMARLNHPNLIGVYDSGDVDGMPYIVMEFVNGKSLYHSAYNLSVEPVQAATIVKGICDGLAHAHENGVIHRDIKPANILLTPKTEPKIGDFGLAHAGEGPGVMMGTPGYTAPEVMSHPEHADRRSDLYSVGVILYELLTGRQPPLEGTIPPPSTLSGCDLSLDQICQKAMNLNPQLRYQDAHEMSVALDAWIRRASQAAAAAAPAAPAGPRPLSPQESGRPQMAGPRKPVAVVARKKDSGALIKNVVILAVLAGGGYFGYQKYQEYAADQAKQEAARKAEDARHAKEAEDAKLAKALADADKRRKAEADKTGPFANETPQESLERLKDQLAAGKRDPMPKGSFVQHGAFSMLIATPMNWREASAFALEHGGYLATTLEDDDLQAFGALVKETPGHSQLWTGAARTGKDIWSLVDGAKWTQTTLPTGIGGMATVDEIGVLHAVDEKEKLPFIIQWRPDGSNPATAEAALARTAPTLLTDNPVYPAGCWMYENRRVLPVFQPCTESEAWQMAKKAGGHLAVTSSKDETGWLSSQVAQLSAPTGFWIGAVRRGQTWMWATHEAWIQPRWSQGFPKGPGNAVLIVPGGGWQNQDPNVKADGFLIEWSKDRNNVPNGMDDDGPALSVTRADGASPEDIAGPARDLREKAKQVLADYEGRRQKALGENLIALRWDLDAATRNLPKNEGQKMKEAIEGFKAGIQRNHLPESAVASLPPELQKAVKRSMDKQKAIDTEWDGKESAALESYIKALQKQQATASSKDAEGFTVALTETSDLQTWLTAVGPTSLGLNPGLTGSFDLERDGDPVVGIWTFQDDVKILVSADHTLNRGEETGTWALTSGNQKKRQYEFKWQSGSWDKLELSADGTKLEGSNSASGKSSAAKDIL